MTITANNKEGFIDIDKIVIVENYVLGVKDTLYTLDIHGKDDIIARTMHRGTYVNDITKGFVIDIMYSDRNIRRALMNIIMLFKEYRRMFKDYTDYVVTVKFNRVKLTINNIFTYTDMISNNTRMCFLDDDTLYDLIIFRSELIVKEPVGYIEDNQAEIPLGIDIKQIRINTIIDIIKVLLQQ